MTFYCTPCRMQVGSMDGHRMLYHPEEYRLLNELTAAAIENAALRARLTDAEEQVARWNRSFLAADRRAVLAEARLAEVEAERDEGDR